jgi:hypothetical protein
MLAAVVGSALGAWWVVTLQRSRAARSMPASRRGTVIFDNTPRAADVDAVI